MSEQTRNYNEDEDIFERKPTQPDDIFLPNATHAGDPPWDNCVNYQYVKPNPIQFHSSHWDNRVSAQHFKPNAKFINVFNLTTNSMPKNESELVTQCRRALVDGTVKDPMDHVRLICLSSGVPGIYNFGRSLRRLADHGDKVSLNAFIIGLHDIEMGSVEEATRIFRAFEADFTGYIDMKEFLFAIRLLGKVRENIINRCYQTTDKNNDDLITVADLRNGKEDKDQILARFLATFEEGDFPLAEITHEEFLNYYAGISSMKMMDISSCYYERSIIYNQNVICDVSAISYLILFIAKITLLILTMLK